MRLIPGSQALDGAARGCVLTVGNFDGLHLGHQELLGTVVSRARKLGRPAALYTFEPHPRRVLFPERSQPTIMSWDQLARGVEESGIDFLIREPFTMDFASLSAEAFLRDIIVRRVAPREIFVGRDFHFGKGRFGSGETLEQIGPQFGIRVEIIPQVLSDGRDVSSSRIRRLLGQGDVEEAARCLGRPYTIWGLVVHGDHRGRSLGFPTANLEPENELIPQGGVYASSVQLFEEDRLDSEIFPSVTNIGSRPTFAPGEILTETHLLDFDADLYGRRLALSFHKRLRAERRFSGPTELARQIAADVERARKLFASPNGHSWLR
jgi:riboflavin kinase/FMN adenylyltransferase